DNEESGILSKSFSKIESETKEVIQKLAELTDNFIQLPPSEKAQEEVFEGLQEYNRLLNQLKQFTEDDEKNPVSVYDEPELFYDRLGITEDQEVMLTTVLANELRERRAQIENIDISQVNLEMTHIHDVTINYDYLIELIARMADEVHEDKMDQAELTKNEIDVEIAKSDSDKEITKVRNFVSKIFTKEFIFDKYPAPRDVEEMNQAMEQSQKDSNIKLYTEFVRTWGLDNSVKPKDLAKLISRHRVGQEDMDKQGELTAMMNDARTDYKEIAAAEVANLSWVKYRIEFRKAFYQMADETKKGE
ncbi:TPA: type I restriction endonuclease subunit R, partial [Enterococcus faecium]|nr:type I restriction endonuclease subunit R [Enterococcus faecium]